MGIEERYIHNIDSGLDKELSEQGFYAEEVVVNFFKTSGYETRLSTEREDSGKVDIGPHQAIDAVMYSEGRPALALQITTSAMKEVREKKMKEMRDRPFVRLDEMKPTDTAIPKALVYLDAKDVRVFSGDPDFSHHPEIATQILNSSIFSLKFDIPKTNNPLEKKAIMHLIEMFEDEKKKYVH